MRRRNRRADGAADGRCDLRDLPEGAKFQILAPIVRGRKGEYRKELLEMRKAGYVRARMNGEIVDLGEDIALDKQKKHTIEIIVDRLVMKAGRCADAAPGRFGGNLAETGRRAGGGPDRQRQDPAL